MFGVRVPTKESPGLQTSGVFAKHDSLISDERLAENCGSLRLTTPIIHVGRKFANREPMTDEEMGILQSLYLPRGPRDWVTAPIVGGQFTEDSGFLSAIDRLRLDGILERLPLEPKDTMRIDDILFSTSIRMQPLSVLWDLADGISKGSPHGSPKPWVIDELQILGFITLGEPIKDGTKGRPPIRLIPTSWGLHFVELTRKYGGVEITDAYRRAARRKGGSARQRFTATDNLAAGFLSNGQVIPYQIKKRMSEYGKQELSKAYGVVFGEVE